MKKSRITKLALLGASTLALVGTLSTSTYAWYVSNKKADVTGGTGSTGSAGSDGSILVGWKAEKDHLFKEITFTDDDFESATKVQGALSPLHYDSSTSKFYGPKSTTDTSAKTITLAADTTADTTHYIQFTVYLYSQAGATVTPKITITNDDSTLAAYDKQLAYVDTSKGSPVEAKQTFVVDALKSIYTQQSVVQSGSTVLSYVAADSTATDGNAHTYWTSCTTTDDLTASIATALQTTSAAQASSTSLSTITVPACASEADALAVTYTIFLDGGDTDCFNSCAGQDISFKLTFTAA